MDLGGRWLFLNFPVLFWRFNWCVSITTKYEELLFFASRDGSFLGLLCEHTCLFAPAPGIRQLQLMLVKVSLILGVEIHVNVEFIKLLEPPEEQTDVGEYVLMNKFITPVCESVHCSTMKPFSVPKSVSILTNTERQVCLWVCICGIIYMLKCHEWQWHAGTRLHILAI